MSSAEHIVENLIMGMKHGRETNDIMDDGCNKDNLEDCSLTYDDAVRIATHVVYGMYDGLFPREAYGEMTNAENIRLMNDEELAHWLDKLQRDAFGHGAKETPILDYPVLYGHWLEWLKEKVDNG